jgi:hypothetical protein
MLTFVTFHVDLRGERSPVPGAPPLPPPVSVADYHRLVTLFFRSVRRFHPSARLVLLTDERTRIALDEPGIELVRSAVDPARLMLHRMRAQLGYLRAAEPGVDLFLLDADMLVNASLEELGAIPEDLALTYRRDPMPINGGFIFVPAAGRRPARAFLERVYGAFETRHADQGAWWGDQIALSEALGPLPPDPGAVIRTGEATVRLLSARTYNYSPDDHYRSIVTPLGTRKVLHFKGRRKRLMPLYWAAHLAGGTGWGATLARGPARARLFLLAAAEALERAGRPAAAPGSTR